MPRLLAAFALFICQVAAEKEFRSFAQGFQTKVRDANVEVAVEGESAFRVSINYKGDPQRRGSQMLASKGLAVRAHIETNDAGISLKTSFGSVFIGIDDAFELRDVNGKSLIESSVLSKYEDGFIYVSLEKPEPGVSAIYGAGAKAGQPLRQKQAQPWIYNHYGTGAESWAPQYYSLTDGYGALAVSAQDWSNRTDYWSYSSDANQLVPDYGHFPVNWTASEQGVTWMADGSSLDLYLMPASDMYAHLKSHADLTGKPKVLPRYAFGFLASRWGWRDRHYIEDTLMSFRKGAFPLDGFITDFEFFGTFNDYGIPDEGNSSYEDFEWNDGLFPDPKTQLEMYKSLGFRMGAIRKPRFGNPKYLAELRENGWLLPGNANQALYLTGPGRHINFTTDGAKQWYAKQNQHYIDAGMNFWWNDEGEIYYFQYHDWNVAEDLGFQMHDSSARTFTLNRAYTPGLQRLGGSVWTGDIAASWESLQQQPGYLHNYNLAGSVYVACDTGGFVGDDVVNSELLARWYWSSAFFSMMRVHSNDKMVPHFPFLFGEEAGNAMRKALEMRYRMIPMLYSLGHGAYETGAAITRPLLMEFGADEKAVDIEDQWLIGDGFMTAPILSEGGQRSVYFPNLPDRHTWFDFASRRVRRGGSDLQVTVALDESPLFVRSGTLLPLGPVIQHVGELPGPDGELEMQVYAGCDGTFTLVEDDGETNAYERGEVRRTNFHWNDANRTLSWTVTGDLVHVSMFRRMVVVVYSVEGVDRRGGLKLGKDGSRSFESQTFV